jgi:hypothetical protein
MPEWFVICPIGLQPLRDGMVADGRVWGQRDAADEKRDAVPESPASLHAHPNPMCPRLAANLLPGPATC